MKLDRAPQQEQDLRPATAPGAEPAPSKRGLSAMPVWPWLAILFLGSAALGAWFLIGPTLHGTRYYKVGYNRTAY
jgi:hypothetical protein